MKTRMSRLITLLPRTLLVGAALAWLAPMSPALAEEKPAVLKVGSLTFKPASPWKLGTEQRPMSQGNFVLPGQDGAPDLVAAFYHFGPGQGGGLEANIKRWEGMFASEPAPKTEQGELAFGDKMAKLVTIHGTYKGSSFSPEKEPKADYTLVAIIINSDGGDVFIRLVGPEKDVAAAKEKIAQLVASAAK